MQQQRQPQPQPHKDATPAIPFSLRLLTNVCSMASVFCFSGIIFGWAPLELLLFREGQYLSLCHKKREDMMLDSSNDNSCPDQRNQLNFIFTMAQFWLSFASLPVGFILDHMPKPYYVILTAVVEIVGLIAFGISDASPLSSSSTHEKSPDYFLFGYCCMALGGCMTMLGAFPASFLLPKYQAGILASISCLFDASSVVFFAFLKLFEWGKGFTRKEMFVAWTIVAAVLYGALFYCWYRLEKRNWKDVLHEEQQRARRQHASSLQRQGGTEEHKDECDDDEKQFASDGDGGTSSSSMSISAYMLDRIHRLKIHDWPLSRQLCTPDFALSIVFVSVHMLRANYFIMTVDNFLYSIGDYDSYYANMFSWILPCGILFVPLIERTFSKLGVLMTLHLADFTGMLFGVLLLIPSLHLQVFNFVLFTCFRAYLYATLNTMIAVTFGVKTMGRVIGFTFTTAAVVSLIQYPVGVATETKFGGDFYPMNILMLGLCIIPVGMSLCFVYYWIRLPITGGGDSSGMVGYGSISQSHDSIQDVASDVDEADFHSSLLLGSPGSTGVLKQIRESRRRQQLEDYFD